MGTPLFILLASAVIALIVLAQDIPTTKWMFKYSARQKKPLWCILQESVTQQIGTHETKPPATTYTEAVKRMQDREEARLVWSASHKNSIRVQRR